MTVIESLPDAWVTQRGDDVIRVLVHAPDPISAAGLASQLRLLPGLRAVDAEDPQQAHVHVVVADAVDEATSAVVRASRVTGARVVLVVGRLDDGGLFGAVEAGASAVLHRIDATPHRIADAVRGAATGDGTLSPDLLGRLLNQVHQLQRRVLGPRGLHLTGLTKREADVLRLVADGFDTNEIAKELSYSERTVKNVIHDITTRLQLRNRAHAVAYAVRHGLI